MVYFHLGGEILRKPAIFVNHTVDKQYGILSADLNTGLTIFMVIKPGFCPPTDSGLIWVYTYNTRDVKALNCDFQILERIY